MDTERFWRGGQEQLFSLIQGMSLKGHQVELAAPPQAPLSEKARARSVRTHAFEQRTEMSPLAFLRFFSLLRREPPYQIVHFNTPKSITMGGLACRARGVPLLISSRRVNFPLKSSLSRFKYRQGGHHILTVSQSIRQTLMEGGLPPERIHVVYEGVDLTWIDRQPPPAMRWSGKPVVGTVSHLSPEKGVGTILEAAALLKERFPEAQYVIVGEGPLRASLMVRARELGISRQVHFTGFRSDSESLLKAFDIFCLPSLSEGLSSAILAAMATRLPVVATSVGGIPELVLEERTGILVPPNSAEKLAWALERLYRDPPLGRRLGEQGRRRIEDSFTIQRKWEETEMLYLKLLRCGGIG